MITKANIGFKIKELEDLVKTTNNPHIRRNFERELTSYRAIKRIFDESEKD